MIFYGCLGTCSEKLKLFIHNYFCFIRNHITFICIAKIRSFLGVEYMKTKIMSSISQVPIFLLSLQMVRVCEFQLRLHNTKPQHYRGIAELPKAVPPQ